MQVFETLGEVFTEYSSPSRASPSGKVIASNPTIQLRLVYELSTRATRLAAHRQRKLAAVIEVRKVVVCH